MGNSEHHADRKNRSECRTEKQQKQKRNNLKSVQSPLKICVIILSGMVAILIGVGAIVCCTGKQHVGQVMQDMGEKITNSPSRFLNNGDTMNDGETAITEDTKQTDSSTCCKVCCFLNCIVLPICVTSGGVLTCIFYE